MMEMDMKEMSFNSNDQLYHILKTDTFTFCLICLVDINNTSDDVGKHLGSANHAESIKCLFKACNPSLIDDIESNRYSDMVLKSVFDISVLLGKESCYVCKKDDYWFCLMCEQSVTESYLFGAALKENIIEHVLSETHVKKVKEVCFLYRFNANQDFLLLNKSVVYCSICKAVMQCKEVELLNTATVHLQKKHPSYETPPISDDFQFETQEALIKSEEQEVAEDVFEPTHRGMSVDYPNTKDKLRNELTEEVKNDPLDDIHVNDESLIDILEDNSMHINVPNHTNFKKPLEIIQFPNDTHFGFCRTCKRKIRPIPVEDQVFVASIDNHFKQKHKSIYVKTSLEGLMNKVIIHNDLEKLKLISEMGQIKKSVKTFIKKNHEIKKHSRFILKTKTDYLCSLCLVSMCPALSDNIVLRDSFHNHFNSSSHRECEKEKKKISKAFTIDENDITIMKLTRNKQIFERKYERTKARKKEKQTQRKLKKLERLQNKMKKIGQRLNINHQEEITESTVMKLETDSSINQQLNN